MVFWRMRWNSSGSSPRRALRVLVRQLQHGVLDDVERHMLVAHGEHRLLERAPLDVCEESRQVPVG